MCRHLSCSAAAVFNFNVHSLIKMAGSQATCSVLQEQCFIVITWGIIWQSSPCLPGEWDGTGPSLHSVHLLISDTWEPSKADSSGSYLAATDMLNGTTSIFCILDVCPKHIISFAKLFFGGVYYLYSEKELWEEGVGDRQAHDGSFTKFAVSDPILRYWKREIIS